MKSSPLPSAFGRRRKGRGHGEQAGGRGEQADGEGLLAQDPDPLMSSCKCLHASLPVRMECTDGTRITPTNSDVSLSRLRNGGVKVRTISVS